jgi:hypothetical protein
MFPAGKSFVSIVQTDLIESKVKRNCTEICCPLVSVLVMGLESLFKEDALNEILERIKYFMYSSHLVSNGTHTRLTTAPHIRANRACRGFI